MKSFLFILLIAVVFGLRSPDEPLITKEFTEYLKQTVTWEVVDYEDNLFKDWTVGEAQNFLLPYVDKLHIMATEDDINLGVPDNFDPRKEKWPQCIHAIRNQGHCGSCWAHGSSEALSDRFCIAGKDVVLSPQDLTSCDRYDHGCNGGGIIEPFRWMMGTGIVTDACFPYVSGDGHVPPCITKCQNNDPLVKYKCKSGSIVEVESISAEQKELYDHGPLDTGFNVYEDFKYYKSGIYEHKSGGYLGGHAVKVLGWGLENGVHYWICANSWGEAWGEAGFFRIKWGQCDIDGGASCTPLI